MLITDQPFTSFVSEQDLKKAITKLQRAKQRLTLNNRRRTS